MTRSASSPEEFVAEMSAQVDAAVARLGKMSSEGEVADGITIAKLLIVALKNELEATEEAALWLTRESDLDVKLALARQCGDEAKHYRLIAARLSQLGLDPSSINPIAEGYSPMFQYLESLGSTVERIAAGQFAREALATVRNEVFADYCASRGDLETAALYRDTILPDERHHHELGRKLLPRFAVDEESQARARAAIMRTLDLAEELQEIARLKKGIARAPGC